MKMRAVLIATLLLAATAALAGKTTTKSTPDSELGLTKTSVFEVVGPICTRLALQAVGEARGASPRAP